MLKQRLLTAAFLVPLFVWGIISLSSYHISLLFALIVILGAWEWSRLMGLKMFPARLAFVVIVMAMLIAAAWAVRFSTRLEWVMSLAAAWWVVALIWIQNYNQIKAEEKDNKKAAITAQPFHHMIIFGLIGVLVLISTWMSLVILHSSGVYGAYWVLFLMVLIWGADSGAYFSGRQWGKRKLAPQVSPGKTWEGVAGALCATIIIALGGSVLLDVSVQDMPALVMLCIVTTLFSIVGDLFESMLKRRAGLKDSGNLLPGHGGILDRIDSVTAAGPVFVLGFMLQGMMA